MFKILIPGQLNNLADDRLEYLINDRMSFQRFLGLGLGDRVPDAKSIRKFREDLKASGGYEELFNLFTKVLEDKGVVTHTGSIIDSTIYLRRPPKYSDPASETEIPGETDGNVNSTTATAAIMPVTADHPADGVTIAILHSTENAPLTNQQLTDKEPAVSSLLAETEPAPNPHSERQKDKDSRWTVKGKKYYYETPMTPYRRVLESEHISAEVKAELTKVFDSLNPVQLQREMRALREELKQMSIRPYGPQSLSRERRVASVLF